ncbi:parathyroid hormone/parathyroid hormone-related peptide receptor-like [Chelonus insularis]|uniref:parathyroid hormone/parathyroid hormone-related peptide receptor-like n=1 Tax=Chelonus insularis TaxID=460826 RepID=UPI00158A01D8|nr:parathyroid hormone/parathyroid hormone-related peptide receptor-like [Chelonus insularis]
MNVMSLHDDIDFNSPSIQQQMLEWQAKKCNNGSIPKKGWCPEIWDSILCWPSTAPGELAALPCPHYIAGFDLQANATRQCNSNGQWYWSMETNSTWSNYTGCYSAKFVTVLMDMPELQSGNVTLIKKYLPVVKLISTVGYAVSLSTLIVAFCILIAIKKLRCPRNMLHMHLFVSFMLRAFMALLKEILFISGIGLSSDVIIKNGESYWFDDSLESNWHCKAFTSIWQYFILANYSWILMEGLYLHNLIFFALFTDSNSSIGGYVILGWGLPAIFVLPWIFMRVSLEDTFCWTTNENSYVFLAIRIPIILSVLINFVLFVNIVRVLFSKLKSSVSEETHRYKRWIRSTLVLVPLFGVHYTVFLGLSYSIGIDERVELIWLTGDQLFASFQGFFVAVLYCFLNGEVRTEVTQTLKRKKWPKLGSKKWRARSTSRCNSTCSCNATKIEEIKHSQTWWKLPWACLLQNQNIHQSTHSMASTQDVTTHGCSLASSRYYLDQNVDQSLNISDAFCHPNNHTSLLKTDYTNQSTLSFHNCEAHSINAIDKMDHANQRWSDSECCSLALELHSFS